MESAPLLLPPGRIKKSLKMRPYYLNAQGLSMITEIVTSEQGQVAGQRREGEV
jgi:hypothetical protein